MDNMSKSKPRTSLTNVACDSKLLSVVRSSMPRIVGGNQGYSCVLCCAQAAHALNAGIKCWHGTFRAISSFSKVKRPYSNDRIWPKGQYLNHIVFLRHQCNKLVQTWGCCMIIDYVGKYKVLKSVMWITKTLFSKGQMVILNDVIWPKGQ